MGLLDYLSFLNPSNKDTKETKVATAADNSDIRGVNGEKIKLIEIGTPGTQIYGGYIQEEYLAELTGRQWMDTIDKMRRSDTNVRMVLNALKLPIKSSPWSIEVKKDIDESDQDEAETQKILFQKVLFEDLGRDFTGVLGEILTFIDFGYSLFDITHKVDNDPRLGVHHTLKSLSYRSQRTIERWNIDSAGDLLSVQQIAYGDEGISAQLDPTFLLHFAPEQEGSNFEGFSVLRPCYGPWLRKNRNLQLLASGQEKYSIPTPVLTVPPASSPEERATARAALERYTSGSVNYLMLPEGFKLEFNNVTIDVDKMRKTIDAENQEMANSALVSFLLLGQNGAGSMALSKDLSDFFGQTVQFIADHISERFERKIFKPLVKMNYGHSRVMVELRCDGLEHRANEAWSTMISNFKAQGLISSDSDTEAYLREKVKLPPKMAQEKVVEDTTEESQGVLFSEAVLGEKKKTKESEIIRSVADEIRRSARVVLPIMGDKYLKALRSSYRSQPSTSKAQAANEAKTPSPDDLTLIMAAIQSVAALDISAEVSRSFGTKPTKLSEIRLAKARTVTQAKAQEQLERAIKELERIQDELLAGADAQVSLNRALDTFSMAKANAESYLTPATKKRIKAQAELYATTQADEIAKAAGFQFQSSLGYAETEDALMRDVSDAVTKAIIGPMTTSGPDVAASRTINEAIMDEARQYEEETGEQILSWTFVAVDDGRTTDICKSLDGHTFAADDPDANKYAPPLHWNCRSHMRVNTTLTRDNPDPSPLPSSVKAKIDGKIQFSEQKKLAEYEGRNIELDKPFRTPNASKKFAVYTKNENGRVVIVRFGDNKMEMKRDDPERLKAFRIRHSCDTNPGPKWKAKYWACRMWSNDPPL